MAKLCSFLQEQEVESFLFYVTVFHSYPLLNFHIDFYIMFTLNFLQLKLEDYKDRLKKGEALNQDQLVSLLCAGLEGLKTFGCGSKAGLLKELRVFSQKQCLQACRYFSQNQINRLLVIRLNAEPTSSLSCFNLHSVP